MQGLFEPVKKNNEAIFEHVKAVICNPPYNFHQEFEAVKLGTQIFELTGYDLVRRTFLWCDRKGSARAAGPLWAAA